MKILLSLYFLFVHMSASYGGVEFEFSTSKIHQGSLERVVLSLDEESISKLDSYKLQGSKVNEVVYIQEVSAFTKKDNDQYEADATIIFLKIPDAPGGSIETPKGKIHFSWGSVEVIPTPITDGFVFGEFQIPEKKKIVFWALLFLILVIAAFVFTKGYKNFKNKKIQKNYLLQLKLQMKNANSYEEIVAVWKKKHEILKTLPELQTHFTNLEKELFLYLFKPTQSEAEKELVKKAYNSFLEHSRGVVNGV